MKDQASLYRHRVTLERRETGQDEFGGVVETWVDGPALFASVEPLKGGEFFSQANLPQVEAKVEMRIRIRFRKGLSSADWRVKHGPTVYDILAVIQDRDHVETQLMVRARALDQGEDQEVNS